MADGGRINPTMGLVEWGLLIALSVLWGATFIFVEVALEDLGPLTIVAGRVGLAAAVLLVAVHVGGYRLPAGAAMWGTFAVMGLLNNGIPFGLIFWSQTQITAGLASILNATTLLFAVVLAPLFVADERLTPGRLAGVALGIGGVAVLIGPAALADFGLQVLAQVAMLGACLSYAFASIYGRRFAGRPPLVVATGQLCASTVIMVPVAILVEGLPGSSLPGVPTLASVAALAAFSTALAYVLYFRILATAGTTNIMLVTVLVPVSAIVLGALFLGERLQSGDAFGMALIGLGIAAIDGRPWRWFRARWRSGTI